jgi:hypothetical protein
MSDWIWRIVTGVLILAILYVLVRPGSKAATAVTDIGSAMTHLVTAAVG